MSSARRWQLFALLEALALAVVLGAWLLEGPDAPPTRDAAGESGTEGISEDRAAGELAGVAPAVTDAPRRDERPLTDPGAGLPAPDAALGIVLSGSVHDESGESVEAVRITLTGPQERVVHTQSTEDGTYALGGLSAGDWRVVARKTGFADLENAIELTTAPFAQRHDLVLTHSTPIRVRFETPSGESLVTAMEEAGMPHDFRVGALAFREAPIGDLLPTTLRAITRNEICEYRSRTGFPGANVTGIDERYDGLLHVKAALPVYVCAVVRHVVVATEPAPAGTEEIVFRISLDSVRALQCGLRVRFVDASTGEGIEGIRVTADDSQTGSFGGPASDADGVFERLDLRPGFLEVETFAGDYEEWRGTLLFEAGRVTDLGDVPLSPHRTQAIRLLRPDGTPAARLGLDLAQLDAWTSPAPFRTRRQVRTDEEGNAALQRVGARRYLLTPPAGPWSRVPLLADLGAVSPAETLTLRLRAGTPVEFEADRVAGSQFVLQTTAGIPVRVSRSLSGEDFTILLEPGEYTTTVLGPDGSRWDQPLSVGSSRMRFVL